MRGALYVGLHAVLSVLMIAAFCLGHRASQEDARRVLVSGILARVLLVAAPVFSTVDVGRYLWDGRVVLAGLDPYRVAPSDTALVALAATWPLPAGHLEIPTLYPPGALAAFAVAASAGPFASLYVWKALVALASVATLLVVARLLEQRGLETRLALVALSPLVVLESGVGAHVDALSALGLVAALYLHTRGRLALAGAALGVGILCKLLPVIALLPLVAGLDRRGRGRLLAGALGTVAFGYAAAFAIGLRPLGSLPTFLAEWRSGSPIFAHVEEFYGVPVAIGVSLALVAAGQIAGIVLSRRSRTAEGIVIALLAALIAAPVVYPWYLVSLAPLLALVPSAAAVGWTITLPLTYQALHGFGMGAAWAPDWTFTPLVRPALVVGGATDLVRMLASAIVPSGMPKR